MLKKIFSSPLALVVLAGLIWFFFIRAKSATSTTSETVDPLKVNRVPRPGYSGPINGPFTWGGIGPAPNGESVILGDLVT